MTNAAAVIGLTYDGTDLQTDPFRIFLEIVRGLNEPPRVRGGDITVPSLPGRVPRNRIADGFVIELRGYASGLGLDESEQRSDFRGVVNELRALFDPLRDPADLVALLEDGTTATCSARPLPTAVWDQVVPAMSSVSFELESLDSDWTIEAPGS